MWKSLPSQHQVGVTQRVLLQTGALLLVSGLRLLTQLTLAELREFRGLPEQQMTKAGQMVALGLMDHLPQEGPTEGTGGPLLGVMETTEPMLLQHGVLP
jgi:hypothetical protein